MTTAAATPVRRPSAVRALTVPLVATAAATVAVDLVNYRYAADAGFALTVRSTWARLRSIGFLVLIWHVRRGRELARPLGLILSVTTVFAVGRLIVPRTGVPPLPGVVGFAVLPLVVLRVGAAVAAGVGLYGLTRAAPAGGSPGARAAEPGGTTPAVPRPRAAGGVGRASGRPGGQVRR
jgi:hypothetical protein